MRSNCIMLTPDEQKALNKALADWGALTRRELQGESASSLSNYSLHALSTLVGVKVAFMRQPAISWSRKADRVDQLIDKLGKVKPKWANAIKWYYTEPGSVRQIAESHGLSKSTYHDRFQSGRDWLGREFFQFN